MTATETHFCDAAYIGLKAAFYTVGDTVILLSLFYSAQSLQNGDFPLERFVYLSLPTLLQALPAYVIFV